LPGGKKQRWVLAAVLLLFVVASAMVAHWIPAHQDSPLRVPVALSPLVAVLALAWLAMRRIISADEMRRKIVTDALAFAFIATGLATVTYGFLEEVAGLPALETWWLWTGMAGFWAVGWLLSWRRFR